MQPSDSGYEPYLRELEDVKAVIFDVYGTLFISSVGDIAVSQENAQESAIRQAFAELKIPIEETPDSIHDLFYSHIQAHRDIKKEEGIVYPEFDVRQIWQDFLDELSATGIINVDLDSKEIEHLALYYEFLVNPAWPMPQAVETLAALRDSGRILGIISNAQFYTLHMFEGLLSKNVVELGFTPECCIWSYQEGRGKPAAFLYERQAEVLKHKFDIQPYEVLYIGNDMKKDIVPASKVGFQTALFAGDRRSLRLYPDDVECAITKPDLAITSLGQILECL